MKKHIKLLTAILAVMMTTALISACSEKSTKNEYHGECGSNLKWTLDIDNVLTISGNGDMWDYEITNDIPWYDYRESIKTIIIEYDVTSIGERAFRGCKYLESISIPESIISIGNRAFTNCSDLTDVYYKGSSSDWNGIDIGNNNDELINAIIHYYDGSSPDNNMSDIDDSDEIFDTESTPVTEFTTMNINISVNLSQDYIDYIYDQNADNDDFVIQEEVRSCLNDEKIDIIYSKDEQISVLDVFENACDKYDIDYALDYSNESVASVNGFSGFSSVDENGEEVVFCWLYTINGVEPTSGRAAHNYVKDGDKIVFTLTCIHKDDSTIRDYVNFGSCGNNLTWTLVKNGVLTISGTGKMWDNTAFPLSQVSSIVIEEGVTTIGCQAFYFCQNLKSITIPSSITSIEISAFYSCDSLTDVYYEGSISDWNNIDIYSYNNELINATIHYNNDY